MRPGSPVGASEAAGPALRPGQYLPACGNGSRTGGIHSADLRRRPKSGSSAFGRPARSIPSGAAPPFPKADALTASAASRTGIPAAGGKPFPVGHAEQPEKLFKALGSSLFRAGDPLRHRLPAVSAGIGNAAGRGLCERVAPAAVSGAGFSELLRSCPDPSRAGTERPRLPKSVNQPL